MSSHNEQASAIRALAMDAVEQANSGHPGMPMGMADIATVLWRNHLRVNPANPEWINRDRFVLSNGHGAMLLYACLHLAGFDLSINDLKSFRQLHSKTPGHPEHGDTAGVETTTGPLGQGLANAVGFALAESRLAAEFNLGKFKIFDNFTYVFAGDGCLMEGVSHEVSSLAGTWKLGKLIVFWDDNGISIDGEVGPWFSEDTAARYEAYGWQVIRDVDGHDPAAIHAAIEAAQSDAARPSLLCCRTSIGFGSPNKVNTAAAHGSPLGADEIAQTKAALNWPHGPFEIPESIYASWRLVEKGTSLQNEWTAMFESYARAHPELAADLKRRMTGALPAHFEEKSEALIALTQARGESMATRKASCQSLESYAAWLPELLGGSADLTGSNCTRVSDAVDYSPDQRTGNYIRYGVREFGMTAIMNGLALYGGHIPFGGTFLTFLDYSRNAVRLSALMSQRVVHVFSHDSIGLGEDGPTHQPIEHINMLRMTPNLETWRPACAVETAVAWQQAIVREGPSALLLTRQSVPAYERTDAVVATIQRGGYVLSDSPEPAVVIIIATGSEVSLAYAAQAVLAEKQIPARVVSMPCTERFLVQDAAYRESVLPQALTARVAIEAGSSECWYRFVGIQGCVIALDHFGASAPAAVLYESFGITTEAVVAAAISLSMDTVQ